MAGAVVNKSDQFALKTLDNGFGKWYIVFEASGEKSPQACSKSEPEVGNGKGFRTAP
jgi:hypothetical protein